MDLAYVKKVLKLVEESNVNEIELEEKGVRIRITKNANNVGFVHQVAPSAMAQQLSPATAPVVQAAPEAAPSPAPERKYHEVKSPIV